ncbi:MFS transporter [Desulfitobacterium hafniense]|uniref:MFS transporter n=1 Tax=Desulfitobacterium hafniense TaxID=49338 RepID=UPI00030365DF|nr:MFS transporter [Desulfitobacterium hafniense]
MAKTIDDYPVTSYVKRIVIASGGTAFLDGFNMIVASVALTLMGDEVAFTPAQMGLYASLYVLGVFLAAFVGGKFGDKFGRTKIYKTAPLAIVIVSVLLLFVHVPWALLVGRFLVGVFVGADYPMTNSIVSEYLPGAYRAKALVILMLAWYIGALVGSIVGFLMYGVGSGWPWLLFTPAVPAIIIFLLRLSVPESARWLVSQGRVAEAEKGLKKVFGNEADVKDLGSVVTGVQMKKTSLLTVFKQGYFKRFFFVAVFWVCQCAPVTVVFMFGPTILQSFGLGEGSISVLGTAIVYVFFMLGVIPAIRLIDSIPRRTTVIATFTMMAVALLLLGLFSNASPLIILILFAAYALPYGLQSVLDNIYPTELFPTEIRGTAVGTLTSISKLGGAIASFLFPIGLAGYGLGPMFIIGAVISVIGLVVSVFLAPETKGKTLEESSAL